jgi:hypothetical protein
MAHQAQQAHQAQMAHQAQQAQQVQGSAMQALKTEHWKKWERFTAKTRMGEGGQVDDHGSRMSVKLIIGSCNSFQYRSTGQE